MRVSCGAPIVSVGAFFKMVFGGGGRDYGGGYGGRREYGSPHLEEHPSGPRVKAVVTWFRADRSFGFVELADGGSDTFLHANVGPSAEHYG